MILVEEIGKVVTAVNDQMNLATPITYLWGHPKEVVNRLQQLTNSITMHDKKYPLIALFTDVVIRENFPLGFFGSANVQIIIANITKQNYTAPERLEYNFKPVLYPIKRIFLQKLYRHRAFSWADLPRMRDIDRYYWGKAGLYGNEGNIFNDYIDAIELQNIELIIKNDICVKPNNLLSHA